MADIHKDEEKIVLDHEYDGIIELDNQLPPWWKNLFLVTIIFGSIYYLGYEFFGWFDHQEKEYEKEKMFYENKAANVEIDVSKLVLKNEIADGKKIYFNKCAVCHGINGEGKTGPNLTDQYWLHGGSYQQIEKTIYDGVKGKPMQAWKNEIGASGTRKVTLYVMSLIGTEPKNALANAGTYYDKPDMGLSVEQLTMPAVEHPGQKMYQQSCAPCHGIKLEGGFASSLLDNVWTMHGGKKEQLTKSIIEGSADFRMPAWGSFLSKEEVDHVVEFILKQRK